MVFAERSMPVPAVNSRVPATKLPGGRSSVQVEVGNPLESTAQISTSKSSPSASSETTIRLVSTQPSVLAPVLTAVWKSCAWSLPPVAALSSPPCKTLLTRMRDVTCASAGIDQRSTPPSASSAMSSSGSGAMRREVVRTRGEEGRDLPDGENRLDVSRRVVRRRDASSGSGARRRDVVMTYPRFAGAKNRGGGGGVNI